MAVKFESQLSELLDAGIIDPATRQRITDYYNQQKPPSANRLMLAFGILGSILVGLGAILIIAHNWDNLSRLAKIVIAFLPLVASQSFCWYVRFTRRDTGHMNEVAASLLFFAIGTCIALVSQVYNIEGSLPSFLLTWAVLFIPVIYIMRSAIGSLLAIVLIGYYGINQAYFSHDHHINWYVILLLSILPGYLWLLKNRPYSNATYFHHWSIVLSCTIMLGMFAGRYDEWLFPAYMSMFSCFYLIGNFPFFKSQKRRSTGYLVIGALGIITVSLIASFDFLWQQIHAARGISELFRSNEMLVGILLTIASILLVLRLNKMQPDHSERPLEFAFLLFLPLCFLALASSSIPQLLTNLGLLLIGILTIRKGLRTDRLEIMNYGLLIITAQILCRFFDTDMSFLLRGILFMLVGAGFFIANYRTINRRKANLSAIQKNQQS